MGASSKTSKNRETPAEAPANRRASPDVVEKRRAARRFNQALLGGSAEALDGRTEKRRRRLLDELAAGAERGSGRELTPIDVLTRLQALLDLGEPLASLRKACPVRRPAPPSDELVATVRRLHRAYGFALEAYRFVGIDDATLRKAGIDRPGTRPARRTAAPAPAEEPRRPGVARSKARSGPGASRGAA